MLFSIIEDDNYFEAAILLNENSAQHFIVIQYFLWVNIHSVGL